MPSKFGQTLVPNAMPSVLIVSDQFPPTKGGIGDYTALLANSLIDRGARVSLFVPKGSVHSNCRASIAAAYPTWSWFTLGLLHRTLESTGAQWVHLQHNGGMYQNCRLAAYLLPLYLRWKRWPGRIAVTFHDINRRPLFPKANALMDWLIRRLAKDADLVIAADTTDVDTLRGFGAIAYQVPIGSNIPVADESAETRAHIRARYDVPPDHFLLGHFGTALGLEILFEAVSRLPLATLLLVGKTVSRGNLGAIDQVPDSIREKLKSLGIESRIRWTSHLPVTDVADALFACDAIVLPYPAGASLRHGGMLAALSQGRALITTTPQKPLGSIISARTLVIVPPGDVPALVTAIKEVLENPDKKSELEKAAFAARDFFSWETISREHMKYYMTSLSETGP